MANKWVERLDNHNLHSHLSAFSDLVTEAEKVDDDTSDAIQYLDRLRTVIEYVANFLNDTDPIYFSEAQLNNLAEILSSINSQISEYKTNKNIGHLDNANNELDSMLVILGRIPRPITSKELRGLGSAVKTLRSSSDDFLKGLEKDKNDLAAQLNSVITDLQTTKNEITTQKARLDTAIAEFQKQFSDAEDARRSQSTDAEAKRAEQFNEAVANREDTFQQMIADQREKLSEMLNENSSSLQNQLTATENKLKEYFEILEKHKQRAEELVYVISNTGMAGGYQKIANEERRSANLWRFIAAGSMIGLIIFGFVFISGTFYEVINYPQLFGRAFAASTFGVLSAYAARQASRHQNNERYNRKMELEIATIDTFLSNLPEDKQQEIKVKLSERLFGREFTPFDDDADAKTGTPFEIVSRLIDVIQDYSKRGS